MRVPLRPLRFEGSVAYVPLPCGLEAMIDAADAEFVGRWNWKIVGPRTYPYVARKDRSADGACVHKRLYREILNAPSELVVDHVNGNTLDNRRCNLRLATRAQNTQNQRVRSDNTSGYKGVHFFPKGEKWRSVIVCCGKKTSLGLFDTPEQAHAAYCEAARRLHGQFARVA